MKNFVKTLLALMAISMLLMGCGSNDQNNSNIRSNITTATVEDTQQENNELAEVKSELAEAKTEIQKLKSSIEELKASSTSEAASKQNLSTDSEIASDQNASQDISINSSHIVLFYYGTVFNLQLYTDNNQSVANPTDLQYDQGEYKRNLDFVAYGLEIDKINYVNNNFEVVSECENHTSYFHFVMDNGSSRADFNGIYTFEFITKDGNKLYSSVKY